MDLLSSFQKLYTDITALFNVCTNLLPELVGKYVPIDPCYYSSKVSKPPNANKESLLSSFLIVLFLFSSLSTLFLLLSILETFPPSGAPACLSVSCFLTLSAHLLKLFLKQQLEQFYGRSKGLVSS